MCQSLVLSKLCFQVLKNCFKDCCRALLNVVRACSYSLRTLVMLCKRKRLKLKACTYYVGARVGDCIGAAIALVGVALAWFWPR